jgi:hypothetical protein
VCRAFLVELTVHRALDRRTPIEEDDAQVQQLVRRARTIFRRYGRQTFLISISSIGFKGAAMSLELPNQKFDPSKLMSPARLGGALLAARAHALDNQTIREATIAKVTGREHMGAAASIAGRMRPQLQLALGREPLFQTRNQTLRNLALPTSGRFAGARRALAAAPAND